MTKHRTVSKEIPLVELTLRRYEKPTNLSERELVRKLCLSMGLLQPGDSRDVIVDVFNVLIKAKKEQKGLTSDEVGKRVIEERKKLRLEMLGTAASNIRRQIKRLKDIFLIEKRLNIYRVIENNSLVDLFEEKIEKLLLPAINSRIKEYLKKIDE